VSSRARAVRVPPRRGWPEPEPHTDAGRVLTELILATFRLYGQLMDVAQDLAARGGITAAWWQVLGGVLDEPRTVAEVARRMGMTRQGVQRVADLLVANGLAEYWANPSHRRAKLLSPTEHGYWSIRQIALAQHPWANHVGEGIGARDLERAVTTMQRLTSVLESGRVATESQWSTYRWSLAARAQSHVDRNS